MSGFIDLHSHWIAGIDDGAKSVAEGAAMLRALRAIGFDKVIGTPHMRPGLFDNDRQSIEAAYARTKTEIDGQPDLPTVDVSCEHYFDDIVFSRLMEGAGLPYPGNKAVLVEFPYDNLPTRVADRLFDIRRKGLRPVIAHPERCRQVWKRPELMEELVDRGMVLLLAIGALVDRFGRSTRRCAERLLETGLYYGASSDAHRLEDVDVVNAGIARLRRVVGDDEATFLLIEGPQAVLEGKVDL